MSVPVPAADGSTPVLGSALIPQPGIDPPGVPDEVATIPISSSVRQNAPPPAPDSELLAAFVERQDPAALTAIVERYSALVYRVALRSLNDRHLADDVFQATFLVLAQSARRIKDGDLLAAWLHGTARNLARRALTHKQSQRHQLSISTSLTRSQKGGEMSTPAELDPLDQLVRRHEQQLLDEELQNLPESSRAPLVLYYLEEKSQAEIAQLMGLTVEAVEGRLRRAKHDLRLRLIRRGVTLSGVVAAATLLTPSFAAAAPTPALISTTITAALGTAAGTSLAAASTTAATLATKEVAAMSLASKATAFVLGTAGVLTVTAGLIFGAVVTSMGREGAERQAAAALVQAEQLASEELSTELALADEVPTAVAPASSPAPKDQTPSEPSGKRTTVHQLKGLTPELRDKLKKYFEDLGADVSVHIATESFVVRADQETHQKFSQEINKQRQAIADAETAIHEGKQLLADKQKTLGDDHPEVQRLQAELRQKQLFLDTTKAVGTTSHDPLGDETSNLGESPRQQRSEIEHREVPAIDDKRQSPSVARTTTITLPETSLSLQPQEIVLLKFPGTVAQAEVQYDRAIDVTPVSGKPDQLRVRGTGDGSCVLTAILANDAVHQVRFQVGTTPAHRFRDLSPAEARILRALSEQVSLEFLDNTLNVALDFITQLKGIPIIIDNDALKAAGVDGNSKVNVVISGITLRSALKLLLEESGLDYCIDKEVLVITTPAGFKERKRLDYYKLSSFSKEGQTAAERFITPLAISVASLEGDLLVNASLDAHRQLEEFLDKAYKLETQKPPRPVELGMESTSRSSLSPQPSDPEVAAQTEQVFYDLLVFQADDDAILELATPVTGGWTPKPTFQEQLTKLTSAKDKKLCPTEILSRPRVTTLMGQSAAIQIGSQIEVDGLKELASAGINIQLTPLEIDSDGKLLTKVEFESSRVESGRVRGDRHLTTVRLPMNSTGTIIGFELKDGDLRMGRTYLLVSDVALRSRDGGVPPIQEPPASASPQNEQVTLSIWMFETTAATVDELTVESSEKRVPKEGFRKLLDEAVKSKKARTICEPSVVLPLGKSGEFLSGGEIPVPVDGDQANTSNSLQYGTKLTLHPYRRSAEGLFVAISGELSTLNPGKNDGNKGADLPTVEGQIIRAFVTIPGSTHEAIVGPIWKSERMNSNGETEKVGIYLRIREDAVRDLPGAVPAAPTLVPSETETTSAAQPETIARVIDLTELPQSTPSEVAEALKLLIEPESWNGTRDIKPLGKSIIVRNTREIVDRCSEAVAEMITKQQKPTAH